MALAGSPTPIHTHTHTHTIRLWGVASCQRAFFPGGWDRLPTVNFHTHAGGGAVSLFFTLLAKVGELVGREREPWCGSLL